MKLVEFLIWKQSYSGPRRLDLNPPSKVITDFQAAESVAWKTLTTILPRAPYSTALGSLLQDPMLAGPSKDSEYFFERERKHMMAASLEYSKVWTFKLNMLYQLDGTSNLFP